MQIADNEVAQERIGGRHGLHRQKKEGGINEGNHDHNLEKIEGSFPLELRTVMRLREEKHHHDGSAIEAKEQAPGRIRQGGLVEQGVEGEDGVGNQQNDQRDVEQEPEQGRAATGAAERGPGAGDGEKTVNVEQECGNTAALLAGSEYEIANGLSRHEGGEQQAY